MTTPTTTPIVDAAPYKTPHLPHLPHIPEWVALVVVAVIVAEFVRRYRSKRRAKTVAWVLADMSRVLKVPVHLNRHVFGRAPVKWERGKLVALSARYGPGSKDTLQGTNELLMGTLSHRMGFLVDIKWDYTKHTARMTRRVPAKPLPSRVDHPVAGGGDATHLPFGITHGGGVVAWDLRLFAHLFVTGATRGGKSVAIRGIAYEAVRQGVEVRVVDPKISLLDLEDYPGVTAFACQELDEMLAVIQGVTEEMRARYAAVKARKVAKEDLPPMLLIVDEAWDLLDQANDLKHPLGQEFRTLGILAGEANIHLLLASQRCDASQFSGAFREQFGVLAIGHLKRGLKQMVDAEGLVTTSTKGRAEVIFPEGSQEVQVYWTPDPLSRECTAKDRALLAALRPGGMTRTFLPAVLGVETRPDGPPDTLPDTCSDTAQTPQWDGRRPIPAEFYGWMERLAADGMTRAEIGRTLKISRPIVSAHLSKLSAAQAPKSLHLVKDD